MESTAEAVKPETTEEKATLDRSSIKFPYLDQDDSVELAKKVFEIGGKSCDKVALAAGFNVSADGGAFSQRLATAKMYGFLFSEKKTVSLTELGQRVVDPAAEKPARATHATAASPRALNDRYDRRPRQRSSPEAAR